MNRFVAAATWSVSLWLLAAGCNSTPSHTATAILPIDDRKTLAFLASDELEGRGIGTAGLERAGTYIADRFAEFRLQPPPGQKNFFQPFEMSGATDMGPGTSLRIGDRTLVAGEHFIPITTTGEARFSGPLFFAGYGMTSEANHYDDYANLDVKGKIVLAMRYEPHDAEGKSRFDDGDWSGAASVASKAKLAQKHGAVALLLVTPPQHHPDENFLNLTQRRRSEKPSIPIIQIKRSVVEELLKGVGTKDLQTLQAKIDQSVKPEPLALNIEATGEVDLEHTAVVVRNVVGFLPGKNTSEFVVIGAHYDHLGRRGGLLSLGRRREIHNGADDNASGTTALLMLARRFAAGPTPERSLIFAAFTAEEEGIIGSNHFVSDPPVPLSQIVAMVNLDMVGRVRPASLQNVRGHASATTTTAPATQDPTPILYVGGAGTAAAFDSMIRQADVRSPLKIRDFGRGGMGPSDHSSFASKKIPVLFLFSGMHADYHRPSDDADKINYQGIEQAVDFAADLIGQLTTMPRQAYVDAADSATSRMALGSSSGGLKVTLGVVPDYSSFDSGGGVRITGTTPGSPAAAAGMKDGDVIVQVDQKTIDTLGDLTEVLAKASVGQKVKIQLLRGESKTPVEVDATLAERKSGG